jgi:hypothetical protein
MHRDPPVDTETSFASSSTIETLPIRREKEINIQGYPTLCLPVERRATEMMGKTISLDFIENYYIIRAPLRKVKNGIAE